MKKINRIAILIISVLIVFESCSVQDHLRPAASDPYSNCLLIQDYDIAIIKIQPDSKLKVGDTHPGPSGFGEIVGKVTEIIDINGQKYALAQGGVGGNDYGYDSQGRVSHYVTDYFLERGAPTYDYAYEPGKIIEKYQNAGLTPVYTTTYTLNEYGLIPAKDVTYDKDGYEIERRFLIDYEGTTGYTKKTILDGNVVKTETKDKSGEYFTTYEYDLTKPNLPNPLPFLGKKDRNLLIKTTTVYTKIADSSTSTNSSIEYRYTFDGDGKVIQKFAISTYDGKQNVSARSYKYKCQ
ncbi:hypothetical protein [Larkinella rosea]|uniref:DUF4595 domain-containing protein n=1 Tax=Larkinella rosea TaxID=2025312 RepID=A0A3P1B9G3_9BACT|nr:hypothetical protein [Larkinella rosea]RRA97678.1 hypothetical protein EHT25_32040 [Larkinella rosea]